MTMLAIFGIENDSLNLAVNLLLFFLGAIWLALIYWTFSDARRRIEDRVLIACATAASLFPVVGTVVYMIVRPPEYLEDVRERELEMQAAEARLSELGQLVCANCGYEVERDFLRCPSCSRKLKDPCVSCSRPLDPTWKLCPYCETEVGATGDINRRSRRRNNNRQATQDRESASATSEHQRRNKRRSETKTASSRQETNS